VLNISLYRHLNFDFMRDIAPVSPTANAPYVVLVTNTLPVATIPEFIAYAKANPGKINMTSTGTGNLTHFSGELFKMMAGIDMLHVPSHGEMEAQSDLLTGRVQVMFDPIVSSIGYIREGKLRALAVTTATRLATLPDVPTVGEFVPGYEVAGWLGIGAPKDTPIEIIDKLNKAIGAGLADPNIKTRLADLGFLPTSMTPAEFGKFIADETDKWARVVKFAGVKLD
jgi:tripartite-type tricarboxylate transporter receptor subunit TctC